MERTSFSATVRALCFALSIPSVVTAICGIDAFFVRLGASDSDYAEDPERTQMGSGCNGAFEQSSSVDTLRCQAKWYDDSQPADTDRCYYSTVLRTDFGHLWESIIRGAHTYISVKRDRLGQLRYVS